MGQVRLCSTHGVAQEEKQQAAQESAHWCAEKVTGAKGAATWASSRDPVSEHRQESLLKASK